MASAPSVSLAQPATATTMFVDATVSNIIAQAANSPMQPPHTSGVLVAGWVGGPKTRGSWSLVYSCVFTIGLCIWTAIHPNVPGPNDGRWRILARKVKWALCALIAPEFVLAVAMQQLYRAWRLRRALGMMKKPPLPTDRSDSLAKAEAVEERKKVRRTRVGVCTT